jgi:hypothetical protein
LVKKLSLSSTYYFIFSPNLVVGYLMVNWII